jgi:membrane-associated phospholipid phosphatase
LECSRATRIGKGRSFGSGEADFSGAMAPLLAVADDPAKPVRRWSGQDARIPAPAK